MSQRDEIQDTTLKILDSHPEGMRWMDLLHAIKSAMPNLEKKFHGSVADLYKREPEIFYKPERGLWKLVKYKETQADTIISKATEIKKEPNKTTEQDFYEPFANYLEEDLEDVTKAIVLGGNRFRDKWGTPDVIGKKESSRSDIIKATTEIVSAEIKTDTGQLITAFGQACAYCIFSHKSYLVVPRTSTEEDLSRLDALCQVFGIGLVLFDAGNPDIPNFQIRVRPKRYEPDMFYTNKYLKLVEKELFE
jgi:hypothetical protein